MEHLQRAVLLLIVCLLLVSPAYIRYTENQYYLESWSEAQAECFFEEICHRGYCIAGEYLAFCERMSSMCGTESVSFEEYQMVFGQNGAEYRSFISWDEIKEELEQEGKYCFLTGSEIRMYLDGKGYFGLVKGENEST